jgi:hypothetical protein
MIWALLLLALCILTFIFSKGRVHISLGQLMIRSVPTSIAMMGYTSIGIAIGVMLK